MRRTCLLIFCAVTAAAISSGQPAPAQPRFEAATIKPNTSADTGSRNDFGAANVTFRNYTLRGIIINAYWVDDLSLDAPAWMSDLRFDITGKVPSASTTFDERRQMLQTLLAERFGLVVHHSSVTRSGFALVQAKGGSRIAPVEDVGGHMNDMRDGNISMLRTTISNFAEGLGHKLKQPVVDETKMTGVYNVTLKYAPDRGTGAQVDDGPSLFTALEDQLGLKLEPRKIPVEVLVVDHCEKTPVEN